MLKGVYQSEKKNGEPYFRSSVTYKGKHISLGSFPTETEANKAYQLALELLNINDSSLELAPVLPEDYQQRGTDISFSKWVMLLNLRNNGMYCRNPIYLYKQYFYYYLDPDTPLKFDKDDLFYYMNHKIIRRGGHLFVADYGMQVNILSRFGIRNYGVAGKDYRFVNGDSLDYRYGNIEIINRYHGVTCSITNGIAVYTTKINSNGAVIVGRYKSEIEAAIAYNKAVHLLHSQGISKNFPENFIEELDEISYAKLYHQIRIRDKIRKIKE